MTNATTDDNTEPTYELINSGQYEEAEWEFVATTRARLHNPNGDDVIAIRTFKAGPKFDDLTDAEDAVHEHTNYWWPDAYPGQGDGPFTDSDAMWEPACDIDDHDTLFDECVESAVHDPTAVLDMLQHRTRNLRAGNRLNSQGEED